MPWNSGSGWWAIIDWLCFACRVQCSRSQQIWAAVAHQEQEPICRTNRWRFRRRRITIKCLWKWRLQTPSQTSSFRYIKFATMLISLPWRLNIFLGSRINSSHDEGIGTEKRQRTSTSNSRNRQPSRFVTIIRVIFTVCCNWLNTCYLILETGPAW